MLHAEEVEDIAYCEEMKAVQMFKEARELGLPFNKWYKWIEEKLNKRRDEHLAEVRAEQEFKNRMFVSRTMTISAENTGERL